MDNSNHIGQENPSKARQADRLTLRIGIFIGIGLIGSLDEVVLHQLLQWHNFYVHTDQFWRIFSDGLFHIFSAGMLVVGLWQLWARRHFLSEAGRVQALVAGILLGMGGFNLYDGLVQHKLLNLHPVREGVADQLPYDLVFNGIALLLLVGGWFLWKKVKDSRNY
ncbi:MAG: Protein of unknown function rane [Chloroflexi bacterium]|jgi:uncharacterized membrane protein|nr:Protein of unknown function rane [Chloroflexota bacterium]